MSRSKESSLAGRVKRVRPIDVCVLGWQPFGPDPPQNTSYSVEWHEHRKNLNQRKQFSLIQARVSICLLLEMS